MPSRGEAFSRNVPGTTERLAARCVGVAGCGGLGSNAAVALVRAGVGSLILVDHDVVEASNLNRQHYFIADIGRRKVDALADHLRAINPGVSLSVHDAEITPDGVGPLFDAADVLVEALDRAESKRWLIGSWCRLHPDRPIVCGNGLSGYGRTEDLVVERVGNVVFCGDGETEMALGLCSARVMAVASMQANVAIELLLDGAVP
jgi:sulfur carrier protein ThiS adenylyltransferase